MSIGENIRKLRKERQYTQEQVADWLGVTAPAVNKWENGNTMPDISILAPLARLLDTDVNTLLDFAEKLTEEEIRKITEEVTEEGLKGNWKKGLEIAKTYLKKYPGSPVLCLQLGGLCISAGAMIPAQEVQIREEYKKKAKELLDFSAKSPDRKTADAARYYQILEAMNQQDFETAETLLQDFQDPVIHKEELYATLFIRQKKYDEAGKALANLMYSKAVSLLSSMDLYALTCKERGNIQKAKEVTEYYFETAVRLGCPAVNPYGAYLSLAMQEKDGQMVCSFKE